MKKLFLKSTYSMKNVLTAPYFGSSSPTFRLNFNSNGKSYEAMVYGVSASTLGYSRVNLDLPMAGPVDVVYDGTTNTWVDPLYKTVEIIEAKEVVINPSTSWYANQMVLSNNRTQVESYTIYNAKTNERLLDGTIDLGSVPSVFTTDEQSKGEYKVVSRAIEYSVSNGALTAEAFSGTLGKQTLIAANVVSIDATRTAVSDFNIALYVNLGNKTSYKRILTEDDVTAQTVGNLFEGDGDVSVGLSADGTKVKVSYTLTAEKLASMLEGTDSVVVDVAEDGQRVEIHLDQSVVNRLARMLVTPTATPASVVLVAVNTANAQTNLKLGNGLQIQGDTLVCTVQGVTGHEGAVILDYPTTITSAQFDELLADKHSCVYFIDGSQSHTSGSLTFRRTLDYVAGNEYIDFWAYDGSGTVQVLTLNRNVNDAITVSRATHKFARLDDSGKLSASYLPAYVNDVLEYASSTSFPTTGEAGILYIAKDTNKAYRWSGTQYSEISQSLALGETAQTAYAGDKGKANADAIAALQEKVTALESGGTGTSAEAISVDTVNTIAQEIYGV